jgi:hypothetical protein
VHHVASVYPIEIQLAQTLAKGEADRGCHLGSNQQDERRTREGVRRSHEGRGAQVTETNSAAAAAAIRALSDEELDQPAPVSLNANAPLTCQFMLEDHAVRHSYHHLARIRAALQEKNSGVGG